MDQVSQSVLAAAASHCSHSKKIGSKAAIVGAWAGLLPDLDVILRNAHSVLGHGDYHRHFTHSLPFIPLGGLLAALPFLMFESYRRIWKWVIAAGVVGYATHGLLDAFTTYGTMLFWPFSKVRVAWDAIFIIDPFYTLPLIIGLYFGVKQKKTQPAWVGLIVSSLYLAFGYWQNARALDAQTVIAQSRGHHLVRGRAIPTPFNLLVWHSIYQAGDQLHADAIRVPYIGRTSFRSGEVVPLFRTDEIRGPAVRPRMELFSQFADGYLYRWKDPDVIADGRYSADPGQHLPLWGVRIQPNQEPATRWTNFFSQHVNKGFENLSKLFDASEYSPLPTLKQ